MKRLYILTDSLDCTEEISREIGGDATKERHVRVIGRNVSELSARRIAVANELEKRELVRNWEIGALVGLLIASAVTAYVVQAEPFGMNLGVFAHGLIFAVITLFGGWVGGMTGMDMLNHQLRAFRGAIDDGQYLILVDVAKDEAAAVKARIALRHPDARLMREGFGGLVAIM